MTDLIVIGGGPAGSTAALRARELGASVTLIERDRLGGVCTNDGCVPTRALAHAARLLRNTDQYADYGLIGQAPELDFPALLARTQAIVHKVHDKKQLLKHLRASGVTVYERAGAASFVDAHTVRLGGGERLLRADKFIIAVGGHARRLPFPGVEHTLTHSDIWNLQRLPRSVAIIGAAATGCQLASILDCFGAQVTMLEMAQTILPAEDAAVAEAMQEAFDRRDIRVITGIGGVERVEPGERTHRLVYKKDGELKRLEVEAIIVAVGWPGNVEGLNLEAAGVAMERGYIAVDDSLRTTAAHVFAAGDINGRMMLVQSAGYEARLAAENALLDRARPYRPIIVPHGGFTDPEYASVGLTEQKAGEMKLDYTVALASMVNLDRAVIDGRTEGFCKLIVDRDSHKLLGGHIVGEQAVEIAQLLAAAMSAEMTIAQLGQLELAYPTYTAIVGIAARRAAQNLGLMELSPEWRALGAYYAAEWERRDPAVADELEPS
jgi:pyruvate/2-oxoglutarate dehydrogenase complex dihydrolipoamide dehydrogenase (E3) component